MTTGKDKMVVEPQWKNKILVLENLVIINLTNAQR